MQHQSDWIQFFKDASIPNQYIQTYAMKFSENRIRFDMLNELDKPLLNEMGITAIGDCLSILKHAKLVITKLGEKNKDYLTIENDQQAKSTKTNDVAKRIIETYLTRSPVQSDEKVNSTSLSADLISRLNFKATPVAPESSSSQSKSIMVTSTTNDDDFELSNKKRKFSEINNDDVLEYRGFLKNNPSIDEKKPSNSKQIPIESSKVSKTMIKRHISMAQPATKTSIINLNKKTAENIRIETVNEKVTQSQMQSTFTKESRFYTLKSDCLNQSIFSRITTQTDNANGQVKLNSTKIESVLTKKKITPIVFEPEGAKKLKPTPITFKTQASKALPQKKVVSFKKTPNSNSMLKFK